MMWFLYSLTLLLVFLKGMGYIQIGWALAFAPVLVPFVVIAIIIIFALLESLMK